MKVAWLIQVLEASGQSAAVFGAVSLWRNPWQWILWKVSCQLRWTTSLCPAPQQSCRDSVPVQLVTQHPCTDTGRAYAAAESQGSGWVQFAKLKLKHDSAFKDRFGDAAVNNSGHLRGYCTTLITSWKYQNITENKITWTHSLKFSFIPFQFKIHIVMLEWSCVFSAAGCVCVCSWFNNLIWRVWYSENWGN